MLVFRKYASYLISEKEDNWFRFWTMEDRSVDKKAVSFSAWWLCKVLL